MYLAHSASFHSAEKICTIKLRDQTSSAAFCWLPETERRYLPPAVGSCTTAFDQMNAQTLPGLLWRRISQWRLTTN